MAGFASEATRTSLQTLLAARQPLCGCDWTMNTDPKQIVILGGGFAGVYTARHLEKLLRPDEASITLVNRENYWVYQPMLPEVISGSIGLGNVVSPIRRLCPRTNLIMREVEDIDLEKQIVTISPGFRPRQLQLKHDHLVIALGNITNFHGMPGMIENAMPFRTLADAMVLRNHLIHVLEEADVEDNPEQRRALLTFVVGGGGFSGVEVMAELNDFVRSVKQNYRRLRDQPHRCVIVQAGDRILPEMSETLADFAQRILRQRGVEIILNDRLKAATSERAILQSGTDIPCRTLISTVPSALPPVVQKLDCPKERDRLLVNTGLELKDYEGKVWALGDCAFVKTVAGTKVPPTAQHATREAATAALNIAAAVRGGKRAQFGFEGLGTMGSLGRGAAVAQIFGVSISGPAWLLWRYIYLSKMPGLNRKVRIVTDWLLRLLFAPELVQTKVTSESNIQTQHFEPGDFIFRQGDLGNSVYVIEEGECEILREQEGVQRPLATLGRGEYFGEMALLSDGTRNATVCARSSMNVLIIPKRDFNKLRHSVPAFGEVFCKLAERRARAKPPQPFAEPNMLSGRSGHPITIRIPTPDASFAYPPGMPARGSGGESGEKVIFQHQCASDLGGLAGATRQDARFCDGRVS
jgi:NADH:ubiquinone reductase (H+-translocating)